MSKELKEFLIDTAYRSAWTFAEAMLSCLTVGQAIADIGWAHSLSISAVATLFVILKQIAKYAKAHINDFDYDLADIQTSFNSESFLDMMGSDYEEVNDENENEPTEE